MFIVMGKWNDGMLECCQKETPFFGTREGIVADYRQGIRIPAIFVMTVFLSCAGIQVPQEIPLN